MKRIEATVYYRTSRFGQGLAYLAAFILLMMALMQLFDFEKTRDALEVLLPAGMVKSILPLASLMVVMEVFALPYFLAVPLSKLARWCALGCAIVVPLAWIAVMIAGLEFKGSNVPMFGSIIQLPLGIGSLLFALVVLALVMSVAVRDRRQQTLLQR